jgi:hypothetical protein
MRDRNDHHLGVRRLLDDTIGRSLHLTAADGAAERMPGKRELADSPDGLPSLVAKLVARADALRVVGYWGQVQYSDRPMGPMGAQWGQVQLPD